MGADELTYWPGAPDPRFGGGLPTRDCTKAGAPAPLGRGYPACPNCRTTGDALGTRPVSCVECGARAPAVDRATARQDAHAAEIRTRLPVAAPGPEVRDGDHA